jgi:hypothetical protein
MVLCHPRLLPTSGLTEFALCWGGAGFEPWTTDLQSGALLLSHLSSSLVNIPTYSHRDKNCPLSDFVCNVFCGINHKMGMDFNCFLGITFLQGLEFRFFLLAFAQFLIPLQYVLSLSNFTEEVDLLKMVTNKER